MSWLLRLGFTLLLVTACSAASGAEIGRAEPLAVPEGPLPTPSLVGGHSPSVRIDNAERALRERGYADLPLLAWGLLEAAQAERDPALIRRALALAPNTPSVHLEAALLLRSPGEFLEALRVLPGSAPALLWLLTLLSAVVGLGLAAAATLVVGVGFVKAVSLHGHRFGHLITSRHPPNWPGVLGIVAWLCLLPWLGLGPLLILGVLGLIAAIPVSRREAGQLALALLLLALLAGPGLDRWARLASLPSFDRGLFAAWRIDRAQPLPGDSEHLERALTRRSNDTFLRLAVAAAWQREGRLERVDQLLDSVPEDAPRLLQARAANRLGIVRLARGEIHPALQEFERARSMEESAAVLYNLSQTYGRALQLSNQSNYFKEARKLDPQLIRARTRRQSANIHDYLIESPIPVIEYLRRSLGSSPGATGIAREIRSWLLGARVPELSWLVLPVLGLLGLAIGSSRTGRCTRCRRPACSECASSASRGILCSHCADLYLCDERSEPGGTQLRKDLDERRQRRILRTQVVARLVLPGVLQVHAGEILGGALRIFGVAVGLGLLLLAHGLPGPTGNHFPAPFEVGGLRLVLPLSAGLLLLVPLYGQALFVQLRRGSSRGSRR